MALTLQIQITTKTQTTLTSTHIPTAITAVVYPDVPSSNACHPRKVPSQPFNPFPQIPQSFLCTLLREVIIYMVGIFDVRQI